MLLVLQARPGQLVRPVLRVPRALRESRVLQARPERLVLPGQPE